MIHPSHKKVTVTVSEIGQATLLATDPETYVSALYTGGCGWMTIQIPSVCLDDLRDLIVEACRRTAPE
jgi:hypothetical protein